MSELVVHCLEGGHGGAYSTRTTATAAYRINSTSQQWVEYMNVEIGVGTIA